MTNMYKYAYSEIYLFKVTISKIAYIIYHLKFLMKVSILSFVPNTCDKILTVERIDMYIILYIYEYK